MEVQDTMGKTDFLKMFVAQLQNQNPLDPMKNEDFSAQLAMFTQVEELENLNTSMTEMINFQASTISALAVGLIGKEVSSQGNQIVYQEGDSGADVSFELADDAATVAITITDEEGKVVRTWELNDMKEGRQTAHWDGLNTDGEAVDPGTYTYVVQAKNLEGESVPTYTYQKGTVTGISFDQGVTFLVVNGEKVTLAEIVGIKEQGA
jgi:flagellar basal-body rod modification protein FlgD